jgi:hypothetical protein
MSISGYGPIGWPLYFSDKTEYFRRLDDFVEQAELHGIGLHINILGGIDPVGELVDDAVDASYLIPGIDFSPDVTRLWRVPVTFSSGRFAGIGMVLWRLFL